MREKENELQKIISAFIRGEQSDGNLFLNLLEELSLQTVSDFKIQEENNGFGSGNVLVLNENSSEPYQLPKLNGIRFSQSINQSMTEKGIEILWQLDILLAMIRDYLEQNYSDNQLWPEVFSSRQKAVDFYLTALEKLERDFEKTDVRYRSVKELSERARELARICREIYPGIMLGTESTILDDEEVPYIIVSSDQNDEDEIENEK